MARNRKYTLEDRLSALLLAIVLAIPTAFLCWWVVNVELAFFDAGFLSSFWLWGTIGVFLVTSFISPDLFVDVLGRVWNLMYRMASWFH